MESQNDVLRDIYESDHILNQEEVEMLNHVDDSYFDTMEELQARIQDKKLIMSDEEFHDLEEKFNEFYFEYGFIQFKRGLELGLAMRQIHS